MVFSLAQLVGMLGYQELVLDRLLATAVQLGSFWRERLQGCVRLMEPGQGISLPVLVSYIITIVCLLVYALIFINNLFIIY